MFGECGRPILPDFLHGWSNSRTRGGGRPARRVVQGAALMHCLHLQTLPLLRPCVATLQRSSAPSRLATQQPQGWAGRAWRLMLPWTRRSCNRRRLTPPILLHLPL